MFTLGSNIPTSDFGRNEMNHLIEAFRQLSEFNFICKSEIEFNNLPTNVLLVDWFQQNELLSMYKFNNFNNFHTLFLIIVVL